MGQCKPTAILNIEHPVSLLECSCLKWHLDMQHHQAPWRLARLTAITLADHLLGHLLLSAKLVLSWLMGLEKPSGLTGLKGCKAMFWLSWKLVAAA